MLDILLGRRHGNCEGTTRRDFLRVGTMGMGALALPALLRSRARAGTAGQPTKDTSVVWLWLGGGPTHIETFDPKMTAPAEFRSTTGEVRTRLAGVTIGGTFPKIAQHIDKLALVRSFAHKNSGHSGGTHWVMTGYDHRAADNGASPIRPSMGSIVARVRGASHAVTGAPTYVRMGGIYADGPAFLGAGYGPFDQNGQARQNMSLSVKRDRIEDRRGLLKQLDSLDRSVDNSGLLEGLDQFEQQAYSLVFGNAPKAFDVAQEDPKTVAAYGKGLGQQLLIARRLCEVGCGFVTIHYGGWDMHGNVATAMRGRSPEMDGAVSAFLADIYDRGLSEQILLVITGEFGRTPRVNNGAGRDHWAPLSTLALSGGGLRTGQVVGESSSKAEYPKSAPISPQDLMATIFHVLGIDPKVRFLSNAGRPTYMLENGQPIPELV